MLFFPYLQKIRCVEGGNRTAMCEPIPRFVFVFVFCAVQREKEEEAKSGQEKQTDKLCSHDDLASFSTAHIQKDLSSRLSTEMFFCFFRISFGEQTKDRLYFEGKFYYACASFSIFLS